MPPRDATDIVLRALWRTAPADLLGLALGQRDLHDVTLIDATPTVVRRAADAAVRATGPHGPFVGHVEADLRPDVSLLKRVAVYGLLLHQDTGLPVRSAVLALESAPTLPSAFRMSYGPRALCRYQVRVVRVFQQPARRLARDPALAALTPFARDVTPSDVLAARACILSEAPRPERGDRLASLYILGGRRFDLATIQSWFTKEELMESVTYRNLVEESWAEGHSRGIEKGIERGVSRGIARLLGHQIEARFPADAPTLLALLDGASAEDLEAVGEAVLFARDADQLRDLILARLRDQGD